MNHYPKQSKNHVVAGTVRLLDVVPDPMGKHSQEQLMSSSKQFNQIIHFPGGTGQRRQANYLIVAGPPGFNGYDYGTRIIFMANRDDPGRLDPGWDTVLSLDHDSTIIPNYLINRVLEQELSGCRLDYIKVYFVTEPVAEKRSEVYRWNFKADRDKPKVDTGYRSRWDQVKGLFGISADGIQGDHHDHAGDYFVYVAAEKPKLEEQERLEILQAVDSKSRTL